MEMKAWAKINLTLDVLGKREDGYHELSSVMQMIDLCDTLVIEKTGAAGIKLSCDLPGLPVDEGNLVYRAAKLLYADGVSIELRKKIPVAAGLGGGSSDCAAALLGLNELLDLKLTRTELYKLGKSLGADVPYCMFGGTALAEGIGERLTSLYRHPQVPLVLAKPPAAVSTKEIFAEWLKRRAPSEPKTPKMLRAIASGEAEKIAACLGNDLMPIAAAMYPEITRLLTAFEGKNALGVNMSGSGPTVYAYFAAENDAHEAHEHIRREFPCYETYIAKTL